VSDAGITYAARFYRRLASIGRLILFDKRDTGLSDRAAGEDTLEQRIDDVRAVMRACGSERAVLFGYSEGGPMSILFAATYPERVTALILGAAAARWPTAPDYPCGQQTEEMASALEDLAAHRWGQGDSIDRYAPSLAGSAAARRSPGGPLRGGRPPHRGRPGPFAAGRHPYRRGRPRR
jgi:pimeloyl-ACP methyl ester carboxylesterase